MRKIFTIIILNISLLIFLFYIAEIFAYKSIFYSGFSLLPDYKKFEKLKDEYLVGNHLYVNYKKPQVNDPIFYTNDGREENGIEYKNKAVLMLGDSYTYGLGLNKEETFSYQLANYTKRPVFNWAFCTEGTEYSVLEFKNPKNIKMLKRQTENNPLEYVIFTYTYPQFGRTFSKNRRYRYYTLRKYSLINGQKYSEFDNLYSILAIKNKLFVSSLYKDGIENSVINLIKVYLKSINNDIKQNFPNAKLIFLIYSDDINVIQQNGMQVTSEAVNSLDINKWKDLAKEGIDVISTEELIGKKAGFDDILQNERTVTIHPNAKAWTKIVPKLAERILL